MSSETLRWSSCLNLVAAAALAAAMLAAPSARAAQPASGSVPAEEAP